MNTNKRLPKADFGNDFKTIFFTLNKGIRVTRSKRKRQNRLREKMKLEFKAAAETNRLKRNHEEKEKHRARKLNKRFHTAVALAYLKELKLIQKIHPVNPEKHLDLLFSCNYLHYKITSLKKKFFGSDN